MIQQVVIDGIGLHTGAPVRVRVAATPGPVRLAAGQLVATMADLVVSSTARATTVEAHGGALRIGTVEHALAALAGLGVHEGVTLEVDGPEMPLLDGGAVAWCDAIARLAPPRARPGVRITRSAAYDVGPSRYELSPGDDAVDVSVYVDLGDARFPPRARWTGDPDDFVSRIAPARTFTLARDVEELVRRGLARHADPASVVVLAPDAVHSSGRPFTADEPARHKLLDLLGDLFLHGGPPLGRVHAVRPGHASNVRALRRAIEDGVIGP